MDFSSIEARFREFEDTFSAKPYEKQKSSLELQLEQFLAMLSPPKSVLSCSGAELVKFLICKDSSGRTKIHALTCSRLAQVCDCPKRLAAGTVDNLVGKLQAIFHSVGRLHVQNPAKSPVVKRYIKFMHEEQASLGVVPTQAVPFGVQNLLILVRYLKSQLSSNSISVIEKFVLARDSAFFVLDFFSADRASDLGRVLAQAVVKLPNNEGYIMSSSFAKNRRSGIVKPFGFKPIAQTEICPFLWLEHYFIVCSELKITLNPGYLFRTTRAKTFVTDSPFCGSAVYNRLKKYLQLAGIPPIFTPHSFRVGVPVVLRSLGCDYSEIAEYIGWSSVEMAKHYTSSVLPQANLETFQRFVNGVV